MHSKITIDTSDNTPAVISPEAIAQSRINEIMQRLTEIDNLSIRALRTKGIAGRGQPQDDTSLLNLDDEAIGLCAELATLQGVSS